jgi:hypothetical protein
MFMAVMKSNFESSGPCIETIINPCNVVLVSLFVPQCCLDSGHTTEPPFTFNTLENQQKNQNFWKKIVMKSLLLRKITRERRIKREMLKIK